MDDRTSYFDTLADLETRHDELLEQLAELDRRVAKVLADCQTGRREGESAA